MVCGQTCGGNLHDALTDSRWKSPSGADSAWKRLYGAEAVETVWIVLLMERPHGLRHGGGSADLVRMSAGTISDRDKATACLLSMLCGSGLRFNRIPKQFMPRGSSGRSRGNFGGSSLPAGVSIYWLLRCPFHQNKTTFPAVPPCRQLSHSSTHKGPVRSSCKFGKSQI